MNGMACIVTALITANHLGALAQEISNLSFTFVAPLCADNNYSSH